MSLQKVIDRLNTAETEMVKASQEPGLSADERLAIRRLIRQSITIRQSFQAAVCRSQWGAAA